MCIHQWASRMSGLLIIHSQNPHEQLFCVIIPQFDGGIWLEHIHLGAKVCISDLQWESFLNRFFFSTVLSFMKTVAFWQFNTLTVVRFYYSRLMYINFFHVYICVFVAGCAAEAGIWFPGLSMGSHLGKLSSHPGCYSGSVRDGAGPLTISYTGKYTPAYTKWASRILMRRLYLL